MAQAKIANMDNVTQSIVVRWISEGFSEAEALNMVQELREEIGEDNWFAIAYFNYMGYSLPDEWDWDNAMFADKNSFAYEYKQEFLNIKKGYEKTLGMEVSPEVALNLIKSTMDYLG